MKLDELEKMAQQTAAYGVHPSGEYIYSFYTEQLQAFAKLIAEKECEACALIADQVSNNTTIHVLEKYSASEIAKSIRARGDV